MSWGSRGLRGSTLEEIINMTNENYRKKGLAVIQKVPTPITPVRVDNESRNITLAYFEQKSTVDYIGAVQGLPVCFDAKETSSKNLAMQNIHPHQVEFMRDFESQQGVSFLLVRFGITDECFLLPFSVLEKCWQAAQKGGRKSIPLDAFYESAYKINPSHGGYYIHYLEALSDYLDELDKSGGDVKI